MVAARLDPEAEVSMSTCHPAATPSLQNLWDKLQLANLTSFLLCPSLPLLPSSCFLLRLTPCLSLFFSCGYVSCLCYLYYKAQISERYLTDFNKPQNWTMMCVCLSASALNFFRAVGGETQVRMKMTSINKVQNSKSNYATCLRKRLISANTTLLPKHIWLHVGLSEK